MKKDATPFSETTIQEFLNSVQAGLALCDPDGEIVRANRIARSFFKRAGFEGASFPCYRLLVGSEEKCRDCPGREKTTEPKKHSLSFKGAEGDVFFKVCCFWWQGGLVLTLHDVTQEISLLRRTDFDRKELQAKNMLLERCCSLNDQEQKFLARLMDQLPDALLTVDETFHIERRNRVASEMLAADGEEFCYALLGHSQPCEGCPARQGFALAEGCKKSHEVNGRVYTEILSVCPNTEGGMLIFRDITRQVEMIEKIREHQETIDQKNNILSALVDFGTFLQKETNVQAAIGRFFDTLLLLWHTPAAAVIVNDVRAGNLWLTEQRGVNDRALLELSRACLSREMQNQGEALLPAETLPWPNANQMPLRGTNGQRVGVVVFQGELCAKHCELIQLVTEPLGSYLHNQLLLRQLEEKANTDALTGLYNRGFLAQALEREAAKHRKYNLPFAVVLADINWLKRTNDLYGHEIGDLLIVRTAKAIRQTLRNMDIAARTGGDEFVALLVNATDANAQNFVERLNNEVFKDLTVPLPDGASLPVTVSLGVAGADKYPADTLIQEADRLMYAAKRKFYENQERYR